MDPIFNLHKVRFAVLDELMQRSGPTFKKGETANVYINLEVILRKMRAQNVEDYLKVRKEEKVYEMISNIINLISHYRLYFTKNKIYSKVFLYMNFPFEGEYKNRIFSPTYRRHYQERYTVDERTRVLRNSLTTVIPFTKIILDYVEDVHFISSNTIESSVLPVILAEQKPATHHFIVSTDPYDYQHVLNGFHVIRPKQQNSYLVTKDNLISIAKMEANVMTKIDVPATFYPFILAVLGDKERSIEKIRGVGIKTILTMLKKGLDAHLISPDLTNVNLLLQVIREEYKDLIMSNYFSTNINIQKQMLNSNDRDAIDKQLTNLYGQHSLKDLNDKYFIEHPIQIMELTSASALLARKTDIFLKGRKP